jgi:hypothetical protein
MTKMKEGDIMQTTRGEKVRIIDATPANGPVYAPKERISVWNIEGGFCTWIHPASLRPIE